MIFQEKRTPWISHLLDEIIELVCAGWLKHQGSLVENATRIGRRYSPLGLLMKPLWLRSANKRSSPLILLHVHTYLDFIIMFFAFLCIVPQTLWYSSIAIEDTPDIHVFYYWIPGGDSIIVTYHPIMNRRIKPAFIAIYSDEWFLEVYNNDI